MATTRHSTTRRAAQALAAAGLLTVAGTGTAMAAQGPNAGHASEQAQPAGEAHGHTGLPSTQGQGAEHASDQALEHASDNSALLREAPAEETPVEEAPVEEAPVETVDTTTDTTADTTTTDTTTDTDGTTAGSYPSVWDAVAECESGGDWSINTGNGYYGGLQFSPDTWLAYGGDQYAATADQATPEQQVEIAQKVLAEQGPGAWPVCSVKAGLTATNGA
ncbi:transglycosylase family protein [Janibacter sp. CX7]|uniref:transglycosylase family protein n=1 Tax=Janibacter sp. CX7 TaxID=2963431 RepID=UPI0026EC7876|nr:transglycosylase family protein [Janibacter sp. CX7]